MDGPVTEDSIWVTEVPDDVFTPGAFAPHSRRQDLKGLRDTLGGLGPPGHCPAVPDHQEGCLIIDATTARAIILQNPAG